MRKLVTLAMVLILSGSICLPETARGELPSMRFDRLRPLGANAGQSVEVEILGADVDGLTGLMFDHPGVSAEPVKDKERRFVIKAAETVPPGTYDVRLVGRWGVSNPRLFAVSRGLTDIAEKEPNNDPATAQEIALNSAFNGESDNNGEDFLAVTLSSGQRIVVDCLARRLESEMDASLEISTPSGRILQSNGDWNGADPLLDFVTPEDGRYVIRINDLRFRGGHPYRLMISNRPHVEAVHPRAIQAGQPAELEVIGRNLPGASVPVVLPNDGPPLTSIRLTAAAPTEPLDFGRYLFLEHPTGHSPLPTAATCTLNGFQWRPTDDFLNALPLLVSESPVTLEAEDNNTVEKAQKLTLPAMVSGRFDQPRDGDWFEFETTEDGQYGFDVYSERISGRADPYLVVLDDQGNRMQEMDDFGHRINAFDGHLRDPSGRIGLAKNRKYRVLVQDRYSRGGARYQYVLSIRRDQPDWFMASIHSQNPGPGGTTLWKGGSAWIDLILHQRDGFSEPVTITAEGLPVGVTMTPTILNNDTRGVLVFTAAPEAVDWTGEITLVSTATINGRQLRREVRPHSRSWNGGDGTSRPARKLALAVRERAPFALSIEPAKVEVESGKSVELTVKAVRHQADFKTNITLQPLMFQGSFSMPNGNILDGASDTKVTITVRDGTRPGDYMLTLLGQGQVPFHKDPAATSRPNTLVSLPSTPVTITVLPKK